MAEKLSDEMYRYYSNPLVLNKAKALEWIERVRDLEEAISDAFADMAMYGRGFTRMAAEGNKHIP